MKRLATAILLSAASILAIADEPQVAERSETLLLARNDTPIRAVPLPQIRLRGEIDPSGTAGRERLWTETLGVVSATLSQQLSNQLRAELGIY